MDMFWQRFKFLTTANLNNTYQPISPEPIHLSQQGTLRGAGEGTSTRKDDHYRWATVICVLATLVNCAILFYTSYLQPHPYDAFFTSPHVAKKTIPSLRRPSQFIGFDKLDPKLLENKSFVNFPMMLSRVDKDSPNDVSWAARGEQTGIGIVFPNSKRVRISPSVSSIAQFRVLEYGMEQCEINIASPVDESLGVNSLSDCSVDVWTLTASGALDPTELTYNNKPSRLQRLGTIGLRDEQTWSRNITCKTESLLTLELAASSANEETCFIEWEQDREKSPAMYIKQYSNTGREKDQLVG